jgi:hypothetical protein
MDTKKRLVESKAEDPEVKEFITRASSIGHPFVTAWMKNYEKHLKETAGNTGGGTVEPEIGVVRGQTVGDAVNATGYQVFATLEIFNAVIRGFTRYMDDSFVKKYQTESVIFKVPLTEYRELVAGISAGEFPHTEKTIDYATVNLSTPESERGGKVTWTRSLLEDTTFDVQAEMLEGLGHSIAKQIQIDILRELVGAYGGEGTNATCLAAYPSGTAVNANTQVLYMTTIAGGAVTTLSSTITWAQFLAVIAAVDIGVSVAGEHELGTTWHTYKTYGPADYVLVSPDVYWQLLGIIQMTNVLYQGSTDPINAGKIKLALGCTIVKQSLLPAGVMIALNSDKAIALVMRRNLKIEPVLFPVWNEYGFIGSVRYGVTRIFNAAIAIGLTTAGATSITVA